MRDDDARALTIANKGRIAMIKSDEGRRDRGIQPRPPKFEGRDHIARYYMVSTIKSATAPQNLILSRAAD